MAEPAEMSVAEVEAELATLAAHMAAAMCRWLELLAEMDRRGGWLGGTTAHWLAWRCGLGPRTAREHVRVARRLGELPRVRAAFSCGELSYAKVRALSRVAEAGSEEGLLELARVMTASQLERALRAYRRVTIDEARDVHEREYLTSYWDEGGSLVVHGRLAPEDGALFLRALDAARDLLWDKDRVERGSAEPPREPRRPTNVDALVAVADRSLASEGCRTGGQRYQVVVHVDETALGDDHGGCELDEGPAIAPETARRLTCDASVLRMRERNGKPLNVGHKTRTIPPALRRALSRRDRGCRFPGCENHRFVDAHHIRHWAHGGETTLTNLVLLCRRHHRAVHEGALTVDEHLRFYERWGGPIPNAPNPPPSSADELCKRNGHLAIDTKTLDNGTGDRMDLGLAVDALIQIAGGRRRVRAP